jgi:hypothetical protein
MPKNHLSIIPRGGVSTLDSLWKEADKLGRVSLEQSYILGKPIEAKVRFTLPTGGRISACGVHTDPAIALGKAIDEARRLKKY